MKIKWSEFPNGHLVSRCQELELLATEGETWLAEIKHKRHECRKELEKRGIKMEQEKYKVIDKPPCFVVEEPNGDKHTITIGGSVIYVVTRRAIGWDGDPYKMLRSFPTWEKFRQIMPKTAAAIQEAPLL